MMLVAYLLSFILLSLGWFEDSWLIPSGGFCVFLSVLSVFAFWVGEFFPETDHPTACSSCLHVTQIAVRLVMVGHPRRG